MDRIRESHRVRLAKLGRVCSPFGSLSQRERAGERENSRLLQRNIRKFPPSSGLRPPFRLAKRGEFLRQLGADGFQQFLGGENAFGFAEFTTLVLDSDVAPITGPENDLHHSAVVGLSLVTFPVEVM